jgi:hypothetical protein
MQALYEDIVISRITMYVDLKATLSVQWNLCTQNMVLELIFYCNTFSSLWKWTWWSGAHGRHEGKSSRVEYASCSVCGGARLGTVAHNIVSLFISKANDMPHGSTETLANLVTVNSDPSMENAVHSWVHTLKDTPFRKIDESLVYKYNFRVLWQWTTRENPSC